MRSVVPLTLLLGLALAGCNGEQDLPRPVSEGVLAPEADTGHHDQDAPAAQPSPLPNANPINPQLPTTGIISTIIPTAGENPTSPRCGYTLFDNQGDGRAMFEPGSAELTDHAGESLKVAAAEILARPPNPDGTPDIQPVGHTDPTPLMLPDGTDGNQQLSERRATAVRDELIALGVPAHRLAQPKGMGSTKLIDEGTDPESLGRNRRVELHTTC